MLSRQAILKYSFKPIGQACNILKVKNAAFMHSGCTSYLGPPMLASKHLNNYGRDHLIYGLQLRHASLSSSAPSDIKPGNSVDIEPIPEPPPPLSEIVHSTAEAFTSEPSFSSMNLGGWSPVGMVQNGMEYLHIDCGLPWWEAVVCGTILLRFLMFPVVILGQRNAARINNTLPQVQHFQAKITDARNRGDKYEAARHTSDMMKFMNENNVNPLKNMIPPLCQAPVFISMFMGLRGLTNVPVESLKTGGMLWFVDLTVPDQFYLLPLITSATLYCTLKVGAEGGQPSQNMLMKYFIMGLPVVMIPFTINFPGLILVYWTTSNFISLAQVGFLRIPKIREYFKIEKLIRHQKSTLPIKDKGFVNNVKDAWNNMKISSELEQRERVDRMAFLKAGRDPIKKTYKYNPTQVRPSSTTVQAKKR